MEYYVTQPKDYWIAPNAINITLNALGDKNRIQCSVVSGAVIMCFLEDVKPASQGGDPENGDGLYYGVNHEPKRWPLSISPTYFNTDSHKYVYVAIPRSETVGTQAVIVFPSEELDIYGRARRLLTSQETGEPLLNEDGEQQVSYEQIGSTDYFYIYLNGIISAPAVNAGTGREERGWERIITDWGKLETAQGREERQNSNEWFSYSQVNQVVTFLKEIAMGMGSSFRNLILNHKNLTDVATSDMAYTDSDTMVATPGYVEKHFLSKSHDDSTPYSLTVGGILRAATGYITSLYSNLVQSTNYTGDGIADTGYRLTANHNGHSKLTIDEIYVRMKAVFESLEVRERTYAGGDQIWSCAGNRINRVDYLGNVETADHAPKMMDVHADGRPAGTGEGDVYSVPVPGDTYGYSYVKVPWLLRQMPFLLRHRFFGRLRRVRIILNEQEDVSGRRAGDADSQIDKIRRARCYFLAKDDDMEVHNWWRINDLARCQTMNLANTTRKTYLSGEDQKAGNIFWWRKVIGVSYEPVKLDDGKEYHYFDVAFDYLLEQEHPEEMATSVLEGSDIPAAQDSVVQFGNTIIEGRMNLMMMEVNGGDAVGYTPTTDAPCLKAYRGIYTFDLNKCWVGGSPRKMMLSPKSGYEFYGPNFKQVTEYDVVPVPVERGLWLNITPTRDDYREHEMVRKCYYYDKVSHNGSYWLCSIVDGAHWVDGNGDYISDATYSALTEAQKALCSRKQNYTIEEPSADSIDWTEVVKKGQSSFKSTVFCRMIATPDNPVSGSYANPSPADSAGTDTDGAVIKWSDGIPEGSKPIWASTRIFSSDGLSPQQSAWTDARRMADTDTYDVEFARKQADDAKPAEPDGHNQHGGDGTQVWFDPTLDASEDFTQMYWMAERSIANGVPGPWAIIRIKGEKGDKGSFKSRVFCRSNNTPSTPRSYTPAGTIYNTYNNPVPPPVTGQPTWTDGIPQGTAILWSSVCTFYADGTNSGWSTPAPETDTADLDIEFSPNGTQPADPVGIAANKDTEETINARQAQGWYDPSRLPAGQQMIWRAECKIKNGVYDGDWVVTRIFGEKGEAASYYVEDYGISAFRTSPSDISSWSSTPPSPTSQKPYVWKRSRLYNPNTNTYGNATYVCLTGEKGVNGKDGWMITANPANVIITQSLNNNTSSFSSATVSFTAKKGNVDATISSLAIPTGQQALSAEFNAAIGTGDDAKKVIVSSPKTHGSPAEYYTEGSFIVTVNVTDPDTNNTISFDVTVLCYANLLGSWKEEVVGDAEKAAAAKVAYIYDSDNPDRVVKYETFGEYVRSSTESMSTLSRKVDGFENSVSQIRQTADEIKMSVNRGYRNYILNPKATDATTGRGTMSKVNDPVMGNVMNVYNSGSGDFQLMCEFDDDNRSDLSYKVVTCYAVVKPKSSGTGQIDFGIWSANQQKPGLAEAHSTAEGVVSDVYCSESGATVGMVSVGNGWYIVWSSFNARSVFSEKKESVGINSVNGSRWLVYGYGVMIGDTCPTLEAILTNTGLRSAGIDISDGTVNLYGNKVTFSNSTGTVSGKVWIDPNDGTIHAIGGDFSGKVTATSGEFTGKIIANSGKIAGDLDVTGGFNVISGTTTVVTINGRTSSTGSNNGNITILDANGLYIKRESEGFRLTTNGFQRWNSSANNGSGGWVNFYGGRYVRTVTSFNFTILLNDDLIIAKPFSSNKRAYLPKQNVPDGKIITIINAGAYGLLVNGNGHDIIGASVYDEVALNINDRMEFIYSLDSSNQNNSKWYANFMPKVDNES